MTKFWRTNYSDFHTTINNFVSISEFLNSIENIHFPYAVFAAVKKNGQMIFPIKIQYQAKFFESTYKLVKS